ncbi:MAG: hypothetical protein ACE5F1_13455 [Planctomycetota bacterium]
MDVTFTNPDLANQKVLIVIRNLLGGEKEVFISLDENGMGTKEVDLPVGWDAAVLQHPTSIDHPIVIMP